MNRRSFIKSIAILGAGASIPLFADDSEPLQWIGHPRKRDRYKVPCDLSEAAIEDLLVKMECTYSDSGRWDFIDKRLIENPELLITPYKSTT